MFTVVRRAATDDPVGDYRRLTLRTDVVGTHANYETADADAQRREREVWTVPDFNPFAFGPVALLSSLPEPILCDWLLDHGVEPWDPGEHQPYWYTVAKPDPLLVRGALDCLRFYAVEPVSPAGEFVVVGRVWSSWAREVTPAGCDVSGGSFRTACRPRGPAPPDPDATGAGPWRWSWAEVVTLPADAPVGGGPAFVVSRWGVAHWLAPLIVDGLLVPGGREVPRLPVRSCADRAAADAHAAESTATAARWLNPFTHQAAEASVIEATFAPAITATAARLGLPPDLVGLVDWYDRTAGLLTHAERLDVWATLPHPVFAVEEVRCE